LFLSDIKEKGKRFGKLKNQARKESPRMVVIGNPTSKA
jgi:RNase H-fold protein (predicted Holliday junction resolvase)